VRRALAALRSTSIENPNVPLTGSRLLSQITDAGEVWSGNETRHGPMAIGAALRSVQIISGMVASCPLHTFEPATRNEVRIPALAAERQGQTPFERVEMTVAHQALWGNAYWRKHRTRDGRFAEFVPIHPARVQIEVDEGLDAAAVGMPFVKKFTVDGRLPFTEYDILHIPGLSLDGVKGISVIEACRRTFNLAANAEEMADKLYRQGMLLSGFLATEQQLEEEQATILKDRWRAKLSGIDNAYEIAVLDRGTKFHQLSMSPADAQFLETRKFSTTETARIFGVPGWLLNDQEKSTSWGTGLEQQFRSFIVVTLASYMHRIEQRVTREILDPRTESAKFKVEGLLRGDSAGRAAFYLSGITGGWLTPNDVRALEDMSPVPWGDEPYLPNNTSAEAQNKEATKPDNTQEGDQ
jgi:HK97 family phage portal protein